MRLQKYLSASGVASRRASEALIRAGRVRVNGDIVTDMGILVEPGKDRVSVDGRAVKPVSDHSYYLFYKPRGVVCTMKDEGGRKCIADFFKGDRSRLYPVGRLDMDSEGLLLITDDGTFANNVMHPRYGVEKEYKATVDKAYAAADAAALLEGVDIGERTPAKAQSVEFATRADGRSAVEITLTQGRNHEVRRMLEAQGYRVLRLRRTRIGTFELGDLRPGERRRISREQAQRLIEKER
jgi:23S rRNA pseudouridine2605 synthase